jgi:hypothetical protein
VLCQYPTEDRTVPLFSGMITAYWRPLPLYFVLRIGVRMSSWPTLRGDVPFSVGRCSAGKRHGFLSLALRLALVVAVALGPAAAVMAVDGKVEDKPLFAYGWAVSPNFQKLVVPCWIGNRDGDQTSDAEGGARRQYLAVVDLKDSHYQFLPFDGDNPDALLAYRDRFTSWAADSETLYYYGAGNWTPGREVCWYPARIDLRTGKAIKSNQAVGSESKVYASPSGRYALIATSGKSMQGALFLLWDPAAGTMHVLLRSEQAPGWCPEDPVAAWSADETKVYVTVSARTAGGAEVWELCACPVDSRGTFTPGTAPVLSVLDNSKYPRPEYQIACGIPAEADRRLQIIDVGPVTRSLLFCRGDTHEYGLFDVVSKKCEKLYFSPFLLKEKDGRIFCRAEYRMWAWRDAHRFGFVKKNRHGETRLGVGDPTRLSEARDMAAGRTVTTRQIQWSAGEWLVYDVATEEHAEPRLRVFEIRAVNARTNEDRLLLSSDLQLRIAEDFRKDVAARKKRGSSGK